MCIGHTLREFSPLFLHVNQYHDDVKHQERLFDLRGLILTLKIKSIFKEACGLRT